MIRPFHQDDIPGVADLHARVFAGTTKPRLDDIRSFFNEIFFRNPWYDQTLPSLVYQEDSGEIVGFLGVVPRRMSMNGRPIRVAVSCHFMVEPGSRSTLAGVQLLKTLFSGPQDLSIADGAGTVGRKIWEALGGTTALLYSIHWTRFLRPSRYVIHRLVKQRLVARLASVSKPFCDISDAIAARMLPHRFGIPMPQLSGEELNVETLLACLSKFSGRGPLRPEYDNCSLKWLFKIVSQKKEHGSFQKVVVRDAAREIVGWYLYYLNPGHISEILQVGARSDSIQRVLDHLSYHAWRRGATALSGRLDPRFLQEFFDSHCLFDRCGPWMLVHSKRPEVLQAVHRGDAFLTRLEGEWLFGIQST